MSYHDPHTHMALARARHDDLLREARNRELARLVAKPKGRGFASRIAGLLHRRSHRPTVPVSS